MTRYDLLFAALKTRDEAAFVPFVMIGDPTPRETVAIVQTLVQNGADAVELGIPFSDPVADGPVIQRAAQRALAGGVTPASCVESIRLIRENHPGLPIGLLVYANLVVNQDPIAFYERVGRAGADSVLIADVPLAEIAPFHAAACAAGIAPVLLLPHDAAPSTITHVARLGRGYTYLLGRAGVTGLETAARAPDATLLSLLHDAGGAPPLIGFGITGPAMVREVMVPGVAGVIVGSGMVAMIEQHHSDLPVMHRRLGDMTRAIKAATSAVRMPAGPRV